ncbi:hypothetical protein GPECTOR_66g249 [Gonium pectorale]|uniref:COR domain-containing protein n=1 Tax=Gonium pectorale TaxID=33097 RepID=A0A150G3X2_GONPE|nr:hypothetical protein GPECTOR_66g249 [Gonium pectorale]|eukprot:KXZ44521.1 hypothetical protein GPECTOR_66g249 [Gonium pectorale]
MTPGAVYCILFRARNYEDAGNLRQLDEYLQRVQTLAPGARMLLVGTHAGVDDLKEALLEVAEEQAVVYKDLPVSFSRLRQAVSTAMRLITPGEAPLMLEEDYRLLAANCGLHTPSQRRQFTDILADFGDVRHYRDVQGMSAVVVLRPQWLAESLATVSRDLAVGLVELLEDMGLLYMVAGKYGDQALVPPLMSEQLEEDCIQQFYEEVDKMQAPESYFSATYTYSNLPDALLCKLLCGLLALPNTSIVKAWRFGAVLKRNKSLLLLLTSKDHAGRNGVGGSVSILVYGSATKIVSVVTEILVQLRTKEFKGVELRDVQYGCTSCLGRWPENKDPGTIKVKALTRKRGSKECSTCDEKLETSFLKQVLEIDQEVVELLSMEEHSQHLEDKFQQVVKELQMCVQSLAEQNTKSILVLKQQVDNMSIVMEGKLDNIQEAQVESLTRIKAIQEMEQKVLECIMTVYDAIRHMDQNTIPVLHLVLPEKESNLVKEVQGCKAKMKTFVAKLQNMFKDKFRLHLLCENPGAPHLTEHEGYPIERPKMWILKHAFLLRLATFTISMLLCKGAESLTHGISDLGISKLSDMFGEHVLKNPVEGYTRLNDLMDQLLTEAEEGGEDKPIKERMRSDEWLVKHQVNVSDACQAARKEIGDLIKSIDVNEECGNLKREHVIGHGYLWLCPCHRSTHRLQRLTSRR